ncbi:hypothetical protein Tco_0413383 [Tanacetum coccineum]
MNTADAGREYTRALHWVLVSIPLPQHVGSSLGIITSSGWPFVFAVLGQMAYLVASITLNNARSCVMQSICGFVGVTIIVVIVNVLQFLPKFRLCDHWFLLCNRALLPEPLTLGLVMASSKKLEALIADNIFLNTLGYLVGLLYSNRFGIGIPPGQGILGESTSSKFNVQSRYSFLLRDNTDSVRSNHRIETQQLLCTLKLIELRTDNTIRTSFLDGAVPMAGASDVDVLF